MSAATLAAPSTNGQKNRKSKAATPEQTRKEVQTVTHSHVRQGAPSSGDAAISFSSPAEASDASPRLEQVWADPIVRLPLKLLVRHPDNRVPLAADIAERAESIKLHGLLEPIIARALENGHYQVLSGETRWKASELLRADDIAARVIECDDAKALKLLAEANSQRKDLNPIEKARLIDRLCQAKEEGGGGLKREEAARIYGLETAAAASNLVRLLELPKPWQQRVASGELPWTWAREMLPVLKLEPVMDFLEKEWPEREHDLYNENAFLSRKNLAENISDAIDRECRPLTGSTRAKSIDLADPQVREQLGVVEVELPTGKKGKTETVAIATDAKAFDELVRKQQERSTKKDAAAVGDERPAKREPTAAERKAAVAQRAEQLRDRVAAFRDKLLRQACGRAIGEGRDNGLRLLLAYVPQTYIGSKPWDLVEAVTGKKPQHDHFREHLWGAVGPLRTPAMQEQLLRQMARRLLAEEPADWRSPIVPHALVEAYATDLEIDVAGAWLWLQASQVPDRDARQAMLEEFLLFHRTEELKDLAQELGVHFLARASSKQAIIKRILGVSRGTTRRLPLPKSIKPLAIAGGKKKARAGR